MAISFYLYIFFCQTIFTKQHSNYRLYIRSRAFLQAVFEVCSSILDSVIMQSSMFDLTSSRVPRPLGKDLKSPPPQGRLQDYFFGCCPGGVAYPGKQWGGGGPRALSLDIKKNSSKSLVLNILVMFCVV